VKPGILTKTAISVAMLLMASAAVHSQTSNVSDSPVMRAMSDELKRSVSELQFRDLEKPYFIQYVILDEEQYRASATFGALTASDIDRRRIMQVQARVGDYDFDNSEFIVGNRGGNDYRK
jgi:TldD protein